MKNENHKELISMLNWQAFLYWTNHLLLTVRGSLNVRFGIAQEKYLKYIPNFTPQQNLQTNL